jgi:formylglycine-generating enzyme required for sulfatase activity
MRAGVLLAVMGGFAASCERPPLHLPDGGGRGGGAGGSGGAGGDGGGADATTEPAPLHVGAEAGDADRSGAPPRLGPSCDGLGPICQGESCCTTLFVPGGAFLLGQGLQPSSASASVSSFYLDEYEVTVGRFRAFADAYDAWRAGGNPRQDAGAHPLIAGSGWQPGAWDSNLGASANALRRDVGSCSPSTWSATGQNDALPMSCLTWYDAFAFCAWDGGRLPTEAEWEYAAAGGPAARLFPWGSDAPTADRAVFDCFGDGDYGAACTLGDILPVGSKPRGAALFGHQDLAGSMWEWALDWLVLRYPPQCVDCANVTDASTGLRIIRGGGWPRDTTSGYLETSFRNNNYPQNGYNSVGVRCAR